MYIKQRKKIIESIALETINQYHPVVDALGIEAYEIDLPNCSLGILLFDLDETPPRIIIGRKFKKLSFLEKNTPVRAIYAGDYYGVDSISLQRPSKWDPQNYIEDVIKSKDSIGKIKPRDKKIFDGYLSYVLKELETSKDFTNI